MKPITLLTLSLLAFLPACTGGGSGGSTSVQVLVGDGPADDLFLFRATLEEIRLRRSNGATTGNVLAQPISLELLGLAERPALVGAATLPQGRYDAVLLRFEPFSYEAVADDGAQVTVNATGDELVARFPGPLDLGGPYARLEVDVSLADSLEGDVSSGTVTFDPTGSSQGSDGSGPRSIDEIRGLLVSADPAQRTLVIDAFSDDDLQVPLGSLGVELTGASLLVDEGGAVFFDVLDFIQALSAGSTLLEVHGCIAGSGVIEATRVEIEDQSAGMGVASTVKIEGFVVGLDPGTSFDLRIREIEKGADVALPVLAALGDPDTITVGIDPATVFFLDVDQPTTDDSLAAGQEVDVRFPEFVSPPFLAGEVEIEREEPEVDGIIVDAGGLPGSFTIRLDEHEPAVVSGAVASAATDVAVDISASELFLGVRGEPALEADDVLAGLMVEVVGVLSGPPDTPSIAATRTKIRPGELGDANVTGIDRAELWFTTSGGEVDDPLGQGAAPGPFTHRIDPAASFRGDAGTAPQLFDLFEGLGAGQFLEVAVRGIGTGTPGEIRAFEIEARVEGP